MVNISVSFNWVKNVYKLCEGVCKSIGKLSTLLTLSRQTTRKIMDNSPFIRNLYSNFNHTYAHLFLQYNPYYMEVLPTIHRAYYYENELKKGIKERN